MRKKSENYLSPPLRKIRAGRKDSARCYLTINGVKKEIMLGVWGSEETKKKYAQIAAEFYSGKTLLIEAAKREDVTVAFLFSQFVEDADQRVANPKLKFDGRELKHYETVMEHVLDLYADLPVNQVNASVYRAIREHLVRIAPETRWKEVGVYCGGKSKELQNRAGTVKRIKAKKPWSESYVRKLMNYLRLIFSWGVGHDLVDLAVVQRFQYVEKLVSDLPDRTPRTDVPDADVQATLPFMTPTVRDMVIIQRQNGLRPSEVCALKVGDIDQSGEIWTASKSGKTTWRTGVPLIVKFCKSDQAILARHIAGKKPEDYVFSARESKKEQLEAAAAARKTKVQPSQVKRKAAKTDEQKLERFLPYFKETSYAHAIRNAQAKARKAGVDVPPWTPYQLRHTAVTATAYEYDRQKAAFLAGHKSLATTSIYAHEAERVKEDLAKERKPYWEPDADSI